jgi:cytochrome c
MRRLYLGGWALALALAPSFLLARVHPFGDAGLNHPAAVPRIPRESSIPAEVSVLLESKCADCHSSQPRAPFYRQFAPVSWLLERDIVAARSQMNLSAWETYTPEQQETLRSKMLQQARAGAMPLLQYRLVHWSTSITPRDIQVLTNWAHPSGGALSSGDATDPGDASRGKTVFEKRCTGCHALTTSHEGPPLAGVFGRHIASVPGFPYSPALRQSNVVWDEHSLDQWLTEPDSFIANSNMDFRVPRAQERRDLIAYFKQLGR